MTAATLPTPPYTAEAPPAAVMSQMICGGLWVTKGLYIVAKLGIADLVAQTPRTAAELASITRTHAPSLYRVLRMLASLGVFAEDDGGRFGLTPLAATLLTDAPGSQRALATLWGEPFHWQAWSGFMHSVETGEAAWEHALGQSLFAYFNDHPAHATLFDQAMTCFSAHEAAAIAAAYDFTEVGTLVDLGGGEGLLLATILDAYPIMRGILFDLPPVAARAELLVRARGIADRCIAVGGSFFTAVPVGDLYLLKNIVHDFSDEQALAILQTVRSAMHAGARLVIAQEAVPAGNTPSVGKLLDMQMLLIGGKERTEAEYRALFTAAGLRLTRVLPTRSPLHLIEGVPA
jgi:hypothetical protein